MAMTLRASIALYDGMTSPLRHMTNAMNTLLSGFERMQDASKNAVDASSLKYARTELAKTETAFDGIEQSIREAGERQKQFNQSIKAGVNASNGLWGKIKSIAGAYIGIQTVTGTMQLSDQLTSTNARLNNAQLMFDDGGSLQELEKKVMASAQRSRTSYMDAASSIAKLGQNASDAFGSMDEVIAFQELINKSFVIGGASVQEQQNTMIQLTQAMASGVLRGEELNSVFEQAPRITQSIADYLDVPIGKIREMAAEGQITSDVVKNAMFAATDDINKAFERIPMTWAQAFTILKNKAIEILQPLLNKINEIVNSEKFQTLAYGMINAFGGIVSILGNVFDLVVNIGSYIVDNWSWIAPIIMGIVTALLLYKAATIAITVVEGIRAAATGVLAAAQALQTGATFAATAAQYGLNAALWACPITWIIALVIALIVVFVIFTEQIVGAIYWLGALFKNIGLWIANVALGVWNTIKNIGLWFQNLFNAIWAIIQNIGFGIANFFLGIWESVKAMANNIGIAFSNAWIWIQEQFWKLVDSIMQGLKNIAEGVNNALGWAGINIDTSSFDVAKGKISELQGAYQDFQDIGAAWDTGFHTYEYVDVGAAWNTNGIDWTKGWNEGYNTYDVFQEGWGTEAYNAGAEVGAGIHDFIMSGFGLFSNDDSGTNPFGEGLMGQLENAINDSGLGGSSGDTADNTARMADTLDITNEELEYLRDIAEREAVNRFTTAEIQVNFGGINNNVSSNMDLDGIVNYTGEGVYEAMEVAAEGV